MDKLISVVIPTFDRKELTDGAVESVFSKSPGLLEIIVVDDCGSHHYTFGAPVNSSGIAVQVIRLQSNGGPGMARKAGVDVADGIYIAFLDSDDRYDIGWMDHVLSVLETSANQATHLMISGITDGERPVGAIVRKVMSAMPVLLQLPMSRLVATMFNPFYMPSIVVHKDLCRFKQGLRYCEDYYSTATALFLADRLFLPNVVACHLGREPNSNGGLSGSARAMYDGEVAVRRSLVGGDFVPFVYRLFLPAGMLYQLARVAVKRAVKFFVARTQGRPL